MDRSTKKLFLCYNIAADSGWALNSAVECHLHTVEVIGSNPIAPTSNQLVLLRLSRPPSSPSLTEYADWVKPQIQIGVRATPAATFMGRKVLYEVGIR